MKVFKKDFKDNLKSVIIWTTSASVMAFFMVSIYDSMIASSMEQWNQMMATMPKAMLDAFQITTLTFENILSYYAMEGYLYVTLILSMFAALLGAKLINKEESEKTSEFILTKPISRIEYITQKLIVLITMVTLSNLITDIILYIGMLIGSKAAVDLHGFILYAEGTYLLSIAFGLVAFAFACVIKRSKGLTGLAIGFVFFSFFIGIVANLSTTLENLKYFSLFKYMDANDLLKNGISLTSIIVFAIVILSSLAISYYAYSKKDIYN